MWKVLMIGVVAVFFALSLRQHKAEYSIIIGIAAGCIIFFYSIKEISIVIDFVDGVMKKLPIENEFFIQLIKMIGVSYCAEFASSICKDVGYSSIACQIESFAKICIIVMSLPGLYFFMDVVEGMW